MDNFSFLSNIDPQTLEKLYEEYQKSPESIENSWKQFFDGFEFAKSNFGKTLQPELFNQEFKVINLIQAYRQRGHLFTETNPVRTRRKYFPTLDYKNFDLTEEDLHTEFQAGEEIGIGSAKLIDIINHLEQTYCKSIGAEYAYIRKPEVVKWFQQKMESTKNTPVFNPRQKIHTYYHLKLAVGFEKFIHKKFVGQKRFSLEGAESLIPALDSIIEHGADLGIEEFVIGMSHRGRLNVLANILNKPYSDIFKEYQGENYAENISLGDVKYHLGYNNNVVTDKGKEVKLNLAPNPSHLEAVDGVIQGISHAKIRRKYQGNYNKLAPILIHGDAAIASQGIVYEVLQMSQLDGYKTGGTIHLVINNQVGFTTNYLEGRSSTYCTDVAKVTRAPVFHVNGDDVEALIFTIKMATEFRQKFHSDVFIDILCYRKYGHNEGNEPRFTQPTLYKQIAAHPNPREIYGNHLIEKGIYTKDDLKKEEKEYNDLLENEFKKSKINGTVDIQQFLKDDYKGFKPVKGSDFFSQINTGVSKKQLIALADKLNFLPPDMKFFKKINKLIDDRKTLIKENKVDWAMGELLAYASLLTQNHAVRLSGQDSIRGTFSHRHAAFILEDTDQKYFPLKNLSNDQASCEILNSPLSEYGVMGFEYGYSLSTPNSLTIWEAQFGDFSNVAQVIIDQFISSAHEKWGLMNGLVLYLPHGYEGQGPEHSSARIERFLTLCANNNMRVVNPTTPANLFHLLRLHIKQDFRVPMIIFTPKSLLRHPRCVSPIDELEEGKFIPVIDDNYVDSEKVTQLVFTTGRLWFDLVAKQEELKIDDIALIRIEQFYPFPIKQVDAIINKYKNVKKYIWAQDEPINLGAWNFVNSNIKNIDLEPVARPSSGAPAGGLFKLHNLRLEKILDKIFRKCTCDDANTVCDMHCVDDTIIDKKTLSLKTNS
jgi:2-oxoglutarate dehydrogenase E1 component